MDKRKRQKKNEIMLATAEGLKQDEKEDKKVNDAQQAKTKRRNCRNLKRRKDGKKDKRKKQKKNEFRLTIAEGLKQDEKRDKKVNDAQAKTERRA